jgi:hypothetical protein
MDVAAGDKMTSQKHLRAEWRLQEIADAEVERVAPGRRIIACVQHFSDSVSWDEDCEEVGRAPWFCGYILPPDDPSAREVISILNRVMAPWQARYDLGLTRG